MVCSGGQLPGGNRGRGVDRRRGPGRDPNPPRYGGYGEQHRAGRHCPHWGETEGLAGGRGVRAETGIARGENGALSPDSLSKRMRATVVVSLFLERYWTADERTVPKIKSQ